MDDQNAGAEQPAENLISRPPTEADLVNLCRELNQRDAKYVVIGGLAIIAAGLPSMTTDVELMVAADLENEAKVIAALATYSAEVSLAFRELQDRICAGLAAEVHRLRRRVRAAVRRCAAARAARVAPVRPRPGGDSPGCAGGEVTPVRAGAVAP